MAEGPSESLDRDINALQEAIFQSTRSLELLDDVQASRNNEGPVPTPTVIAQASDFNNIEEYLQRFFERIFKDNNLTTEQTKQLLRLCSHNNESVAQWLTRHNELNPLCTWDILTNDLLNECLSPYWRSEKYSKIFKI
ncbi:hypothetical protein ROZALSC1DRAFT_26145, partial [Rozella allomycis CSF55]